MSSLLASLRLLAAIATSVALFALATMGFRAFTTDTARVVRVADRPVALPAVAVVDQSGAPRPLADRQRVTIVQFFYSRCITVCATGGDAVQQLQAAIVRRGLTSQVRLLSISFDPAWDTPARLQSYARLLRADTAVWTMAAPASAAALPVLLRAFGVRVIPDGVGGFAHNAAFHVVDRTGRLIAISPLVDPGLDSRRGDAALSREAFRDAIDLALDQALRVAPRVAPRLALGTDGARD